MLKIEKITDKVEELDVQGQHPDMHCYITQGNIQYGCLYDCTTVDQPAYYVTTAL